MSRIIKTETASKERTAWSRLVVVALRELMGLQSPDGLGKDLVAFIVEGLVKIYDSVESSVTAWEKRGYFVKADRFRLEWDWTIRLSEKLKMLLLNDDWDKIALTIAELGQRFKSVKIPARFKHQSPWIGAWDRMKK